MLSEDVCELLGQFNLFVLFDPVFVLEFLSLCPCASIEAALEIVDLLNGAFLFSLDLPENVFHADEVNCIYFLFVLVYLQLVKSKYSHNQRIRVLTQVFIIVMDYLREEDELSLRKRLQKDFVVRCQVKKGS